MRRANSLEKTLMLGKIEGRRRRGQQRMRWLNDITHSMDMSFTSPGSWWWTGRPGVLQSMGSQRVRHNWATELKPLQWMFLKKDSPDSIEHHYQPHVRSTGLYSQQVCVSLCVHLYALSLVWLFAIPWTVAHHAPLSIRFFQARILEWVTIPFSRGSSWPRDRTRVSRESCIGKRNLYHYHHLGMLSISQRHGVVELQGVP